VHSIKYIIEWFLPFYVIKGACLLVVGCNWQKNCAGQVSELESQIDSFEAEVEGLQLKKGKARSPHLVLCSSFLC
jgi:outer membrane murein-binding lipoprotein Lpp